MADAVLNEIGKLKDTFTDHNQQFFELSHTILESLGRSVAEWTSDSRCRLRMTEQCPRYRALVRGEINAPRCLDCVFKT